MTEAQRRALDELIGEKLMDAELTGLHVDVSDSELDLAIEEHPPLAPRRAGRLRHGGPLPHLLDRAQLGQLPVQHAQQTQRVVARVLVEREHLEATPIRHRRLPQRRRFPNHRGHGRLTVA